MSSPCSLTIRATTGDITVRIDWSPASPPPLPTCSAAGAGALSARSAGASAAAGWAAGAASAAGASPDGSSALAGAGPSPVWMTARRVSTGTVSPSGTRISATIPEAGEGTSVSTLSVEISTMVSSASTRSPTPLSQRLTVPSDTLTPIWGITTSTVLPTAMAGRSLGSLRWRRPRAAQTRRARRAQGSRPPVWCGPGGGPDRDSRPAEAVRPTRRARRRRPARAGGHDLRLPRAQRRGEVHDHAHPGGDAAGRRRGGAAARRRPLARRRRPARPAGLPAQRPGPVRAHDRGRAAAPLRPPRAARAGAARGGARRAGAGRRRPGPPAARLLPRHAPEGGDRPGAAARPGAADPRRAQRGPRPAGAGGLLRPPAGPARRRAHGLPVLARALRGGAAVRARGPDPRGADRRRGHDRAPAARGAPGACGSSCARARRPRRACPAPRPWSATATSLVLAHRGEPGPLLRALAELDPVDVTIEEPGLEEIFLGYYRADGPGA